MKKNDELLNTKYNEIPKDEYKKANKLVENDIYYRPTYHIAPPNGLLNDPNGLVYKDGVHHIHYQWTPIQPYHGLKHWRYFTTKNFIDFEDHGVSIVPEEEFEINGAFSGSAIDLGDKIKLYYTGNIEDESNNIAKEHQISADLINGVVTNKKIAVEWDATKFTPHARDPKIFEYEGQKYMLFGVQSSDDKDGGLAIYKMINEDQFEYKTTLKSNNNYYGYMWECPNLDKVGDKYLFIMSSEGWIKEDDKYELNGFRNVVYTLIEKLDFDDIKLNELFEPRTMDYGHDFYAPQTYFENNKLLVIGWMGAVGVQYPTDQYSWHSMLTIPRELSVEGDNLIQKPYIGFTMNALSETETIFDDNLEVKKSIHLKFELDDILEIKISNDQGENVVISFSEKEIMLDRDCGSEIVDWDYENPRFAKRKLKEQTVEIFIDSSSIELFADNYQTVFTSRFFVKNFNRIELSKKTNMQVSKIKSIKVIN